MATPDLSRDSNGYCDDVDCKVTLLLHWMTPTGEDIGPTISLGTGRVVNNWGTEFTLAFSLIPRTPGSTASPVLKVFSPDSDGDDIPDDVEVGGCTSAANFDSDFDGTPDSLEDPDSDGLIGASDPAPCVAKTRPHPGGGGGGGGCVLAPGESGTGAGWGMVLPFVVAIAFRLLRRRARP